MGLLVLHHEARRVEVRIALRRAQARVAQQFLNRAQIGAGLQQVGRERMAQRVRADAEARRGLARGRFPMLGSGEVFYHLTYIDDLTGLYNQRYLEIAVVARMPGFLSAMDLEYNAYPDFESLEVYCRRVRGVLQRMQSRVFGYDDPQTLEGIFAETPLQLAAHCEYSPLIWENEKRAREQYGEAVPIELEITAQRPSAVTCAVWLRSG
mgnify:CR=1 FL=1